MNQISPEFTAASEADTQTRQSLPVYALVSHTVFVSWCLWNPFTVAPTDKSGVKLQFGESCTAVLLYAKVWRLTGKKVYGTYIHTQKKQTANSSYSGVGPAIPKLDKFELYPAAHPKLKSNKKTIKHSLCVFNLICCWQVYFQIRLFVSDDKIWNKFRIKNILEPIQHARQTTESLFTHEQRIWNQKKTKTSVMKEWNLMSMWQWVGLLQLQCVEPHIVITSV